MPTTRRWWPPSPPGCWTSWPTASASSSGPRVPATTWSPPSSARRRRRPGPPAGPREALETLLATDDGANLLAAYKRAANILRIEEEGRAASTGRSMPACWRCRPKPTLAAAVEASGRRGRRRLAAEDFAAAMAALAGAAAAARCLFRHGDGERPRSGTQRANRLRLLSRLRAAMDAVADFSKIEGELTAWHTARRVPTGSHAIARNRP